MPSLAESRAQVQEGLSKQAQEVDHEDILASLQDEIDRHNAAKDDLRKAVHRSRRRRRQEDDESGQERSLKFRFKEGVSDPRKRKHHRSDDGHRKHHKRRKEDYPTPPEDEGEEAHPFPREPTGAGVEGAPSGDAAFRDSLFDALADDEGAHYWESVYSQPIHVYSRPIVQTPEGELEQMNDEQYAAYVKTKMWERKHPEIVQEREKAEKQRREEEEERTRRREEFVRKKQRAAWEKAERKGARRFAGVSDADDEDEQYEYEFTGKANYSSAQPAKDEPQQAEYTEAWSRYLSDWEVLKQDLLAHPPTSDVDTTQSPSASQRIPWPVLSPSLPVVKRNIEDFMRHAPAEDGKMRLQVLKAERVRWHPDKVQQRFGGMVEEGTMRLVTGVFQIIDSVFEEVRQRQS